MRGEGFILLAHYREQWWAHVNRGINFLVPYNAQNFVIS